MSLNITTPVNTSIGVTIPTSYARVAIMEGLHGTALVSNLAIYPTKESFKAGADPLPVIINGRFMESGITLEYNRELDGADLLGLAHTAWIAKLGDWGITATEDLSLSL
jgi:hypothetical protein